jgi:hypothetical protein
MNIPKTTTAEVLQTLILKGEASITDFPYLSGFRTRISNLVLIYKLKLKSEVLRGVNKHGNKITYINHILEPTELKNAIELYELINKSK